MVIEGDKSKFVFFFLREEVGEEDPEYKTTCCKFVVFLLILTERRTGPNNL